MKQKDYLANAFEQVRTDSAETLKALHCKDGRVLGIVPWCGSILVYTDADALQQNIPTAFKHRVLDASADGSVDWVRVLQTRANAVVNTPVKPEHCIVVNRKALLDILNACEHDVVQLECLSDVFSSTDTPVAIAATRETLALVQKYMHNGQSVVYMQDALCITDGAGADTDDGIIVQLGAVRVVRPVMPLRIAFAQTKPKQKKTAKAKLKLKKKGTAIANVIMPATKSNATSMRDRLKQLK